MADSYEGALTKTNYASVVLHACESLHEALRSIVGCVVKPDTGTVEISVVVNNPFRDAGDRDEAMAWKLTCTYESSSDDGSSAVLVESDLDGRSDRFECGVCSIDYSEGELKRRMLEVFLDAGLVYEDHERRFCLKEDGTILLDDEKPTDDQEGVKQ